MLPKAWRREFRTWLNTLTFEHNALEVTFLEYVAETDHTAERIGRLERAIDEAVAAAPAHLQALVRGVQALRGVAKVTAVTMVTEQGDLSRFGSAPQVMSYAGIVPREHSSGDRISHGGVTKSGDAHVRRVVVEAAWAYRHRPKTGAVLRGRQEGESAAIVGIAWRTQQRLHKRYCSLVRAGKHKNKVVVAVARELLGFMWAIGRQVHQELTPRG